MLKFSEKNNVFTTSVYGKPSFSGVCAHFDAYIPLNYKSGLVSANIFRRFTILSDMPKFHQFKQLLSVIFKIFSLMKNYFNFKDKINRELCSLLVNNFKCNNCNGEYIGKPNDIIERKLRNKLVFLHSQGNVSEITLKLQPHVIICLFVR